MRPGNPFFGEEPARERSDAEPEALLRAVPGAAEVTSDVIVDLSLATAPTVTLPVLAGVTLALLGALVPARRAARLTISEALRSE
ncbi:hypothetical protein ACF06X_28535 [Streptomyces sp. NPDC015346]|uniref:hypothetical protein n=1 Tax=Streptomyces sp. NPDC015346 TaxID=3364954 RepID=UPI003702D45A